MKILLLGDFSGVHLNLRDGLRELGHKVLLVSKGDGFKKLASDKKVYSRSANESKIFGAFKEVTSQLKLLPSLRGFDIVQTASHQFFHNRINSFVFPRVLKNNRKSVLLNTACTFPYRRFVAGLEYSPCASCEVFDLHGKGCQHQVSQLIEKEKSVYASFDHIVSTHYEYFEGFNKAGYAGKNSLIFVPVNLDQHPFTPAKLGMNDKIIVYYGEIRKGFKGGTFIEEGLDMLAGSEYGSHFEIIRSSRLPYSEYIEILNKAHIVIDQASSYTYGMNALFSMARGKIVLTGAEPSAFASTGIDQADAPMINIKPDAKQVCDQLTGMLGRRNDFEDLANRGRQFVERYHDHRMIAGKYQELYTRLLA